VVLDSHPQTEFLVSRH